MRPAADDDDTLLRTSSFRVLIDDQEVGIGDISPLTSRTDSAPDQEHRHAFDTVVLRRALTRSTDLYDWRRRIATGTHDRRTVTIHQLVAPGGAVANTWQLVGAWPTRWSGPSFDARSNELATEELELAFDDLVWLHRDDHQGG